MGATMTQKDLSAGLLREDQYNHIDDPESLKYIYDNFFRSSRVPLNQKNKSVRFEEDYREQIDNMMATFKYGFLMRGRQDNDVWLMIPIYEDNDVHDISALSVGSVLVLEDSRPLSDIFDVNGADPLYFYEPLKSSIWEGLIDGTYYDAINKMNVR
jgi:hypothetical protein